MAAGCKEAEEYSVNLIEDGAIVLDGKAEEKEWKTAPSISSFMNPWNKDVNPETALMLLKDSEFLYFYFDAKDEEIVIHVDFSKERDVEKEDRVELFLSKDAKMSTYYCFETDALGRTLSYEANHYRKLRFDWDVPEGYRVKSRRYEGGYAIEGAIPLSFIISLANQKELYFGAYRAEFSMVNDSIVENWLTWINPNTPFPDFHVPATLGKLYWK